MQENPREYVRMLAALAGAPVSVEHIAAVAQALPLLHGGCEALAAVDYGDIEPAPVFRPAKEPGP